MQSDETSDSEALEWSLAFSLWHHRKLLPSGKADRNRLEAYRVAARQVARHLEQSNFKIALGAPPKLHSGGD